MTISGFTMVRNAGKFYYPIKEAILSVLPIVDEFIVALGDNDPDDNTRQQIESIGSDKIKIYDRVWEEKHFVDGHIFKLETDFALSKCSGDYCLYLQADEVVHENDLDKILATCKKYKDLDNIDGLLFNYYHLWGDYEHHLPYHGWCRKEIRIIKNGKGIQSYKDALSFRSKDNTKLNVKPTDIHIYHYGFVRPPSIMVPKKKAQDGMHLGKEKADEMYSDINLLYDYGPLGKIPSFKKDHPKVMHERMKLHNWKDQLNYSNKWGSNNKAPRTPFKHEQMKYRLISWVENKLDIEIFSFKNYNLIK